MDWQQILIKLRQIKEHFDRSYKCLNTDRPTKEETVEKHLKILYERFEQIRIVLNVNYSRLTQSHKSAAEGFFSDVRDKLASVLSRRGLEVKLPLTLHEKLTVDQVGGNSDLTPQESSRNPETMPQSIVEFLGIASKILPDFDGKAQNLQSFLDALSLVDSIKETHDTVAVNLVKTKLKGAARNILTTETTLQEVIVKLRTTVRGESVDVLSAKLMNIKQTGKNSNAYAKEVEDLTKALEGAYISDGLPAEIAAKYSTQMAVKAIVKNSQNDRVKLIIESGNFMNMNELIAKFIGSCTEAYGQPNSILKFNSNYRGRGRGYKRGRGNHGYNDNYGNGNRNANQNSVRGRGSNRYGRGNYNHRNGRNVRHVTENSSENGAQPLSTQN